VWCGWHCEILLHVGRPIETVLVFTVVIAAIAIMAGIIFFLHR
jgi:hypothetical protein